MDGYLSSFSFLGFMLLGLVVTNHAALLPSEVYWQRLLPNTPMPNAISDLLRPDSRDGKTDTSVDVRKDGIQRDDRNGSWRGQSTVDVGGKSVNVSRGNNTRVDVGSGGITVSRGNKGNPVVVRMDPFIYSYAASADQLHDNPKIQLFFLEKDLQPGTKMRLHFIKTTPGTTFAPRDVANALSFSSNKLQEILQLFSIEPHSQVAKAVEETIHKCEAPPIKGEDKYCAMSLESMIDFATSKLGTHVRVLATEVKEKPKQEYTIASRMIKIAGTQSVSCHGQTYMYAVYYCHQTHATKTYIVPLIGKDGARIEAVAVCHTDTSSWNPRHVAFQVLKVEPGTATICHFLPQDHIVWVQR